MQRAQPRQSGFTLIELMVVVAIIGILASIAVPNYQKFIFRSRAAERTLVVGRIKQSVDNYLLQAEISSAGTWLWGPETPPLMNPGPNASKRVANWKQQGWETLTTWGFEVDGAVYYTYGMWFSYFPGNGGFLQVWTVGDLDADGNKVTHYNIWTRDTPWASCGQKAIFCPYPWWPGPPTTIALGEYAWPDIPGTEAF